MNLEEALEVQVGDLRLVIHAQQLGECGVGEDAALERGVKAAVGLHVVGDELGHLRLGALGASRDTHELAELLRQGLLLEEGVVRTASLPDSAGLGGERRGVNLPLLLGVTRLLLGLLGSLLGRLHGITHAARELRGERLELLRQRREERIRGQAGGSDRRGGHRGHNDLGLGDGHLLLLGLGGLGGRGGRGDDDGLGGLLGNDLLVSGHLVCLRDRRSRGHF